MQADGAAQVANGVAASTIYSVGLLNDVRAPWCNPAEYERRFDRVLRGDRASLDPVTDLLERAAARAEA